MKRLILSILIVCFVLSGVTLLYILKVKSSAKASVSFSLFPAYTHEDLTNRADIIVRGKIQNNMTASWNNSENKRPARITGKDFIYGDSFLTITEVYKGDTRIGETAIIRCYGGQVDGVYADYRELPQLIKGSDVIVFLVLDKSIYNQMKNENQYILLGAQQGIYEVVGNEVYSLERKSRLSDFSELTKHYINNPKAYLKGNSDE